MAPKKNKKDNYIIDSIEDIKKELYVIKNNFDMETDESLIDCYIYQMEALGKKYEYLLKKAKESGVKADGFETKGGKSICSRLL
ncbi:YaaL family protein [Lachnospiraceae bacterium NSJ-143]|nr:YaaL family protein [Lachnospiraceae bacterium NSJ-143]